MSNRFRRFHSCWLLPAVLMAGCQRAVVEPGPAAAYHELTALAFAAHVGYLANPELAGRMTATAGNDTAAEYIARQFAQVGLVPGSQQGGWYQQFPVEKTRVPTDECLLRFDFGHEGEGGSAVESPRQTDIPGVLHTDYSPMAIGSSGMLSGPLVFAGYGLQNWIRSYDDYEGIDVRGAVVMIMQGEPHDEEGRSKWALSGKWTRLAGLEYKLKEAMSQGSVGVLVVTPPAISPSHDPLYNVLGDGTGLLPAIRISREFADRILSVAGADTTLAETVRHIHESSRPRSFRLGGTVAGQVDFTIGTGRNVIGMLPSTTATEAGVIVIGAHYDHIGASDKLAKDVGFGVRPGADDNASGVSAMILIARALTKTPERKCTYVFISFGGEEIGFLGSKYYVHHPSVALERTQLMVNLDQVGYLRGDRLFVLGSVWSSPISEALTQAERLNPSLNVIRIPFTSKSRLSDQAAFAKAGLATLFFSAGITRFYSTMHDTADRINNDGGAHVARLVYEAARNTECYMR